MRRLALSFSLAASLIGASTAEAQLVNGGFESGIAPWTSTSYCGAFSASCTAWSTLAGEGRAGTTAAVGVGNVRLEQTIAGTAVAEITSLSYWIRQSSASVSATFLGYSDGSVAETLVNVGTTYQQVNLFALLAPGKTLTRFGLYGVSGNGVTTYVDDFQLGSSTNVVPEPASFALVAAGLAGVTMVARRRRTA